MEDRLYNLTMDFSVRVIKLANVLRANNESIVSNQIARSATSVGANYSEAKYAASPADFVNKLRIALKEANETAYWLEILLNSEYINEEEYKPLEELCRKIKILLIKSINTTVKNNDL